MEAVHAATAADVTLVELGFFGEKWAGDPDNRNGYSDLMYDSRVWFEANSRVYLGVTFGVPLGCSVVTFFACALRLSAPALHAGHAMILLLPWVWLIGASFELPLSIATQDGCAQLETFGRRALHDAGDDGTPALGRIAEPAYAYMTSCAEGDPMEDLLAPVHAATLDAQANATELLAPFSLRAPIRAHVDTLGHESAELTAALDAARSAMDCAEIHGHYVHAKTGLCCDFGYGITFLWVCRLASAVILIPAAIAALAGYKRFPRRVWGPYASVQAREVGAYL